MQEEQLRGLAKLALIIAQLRAVLEDAERVGADGSVASGREAAKRSLVGVIMFVAQAYGPHLGRSLQGTLTALENLDDGKVDPIIERPNLGQNPGNPSSLYIYRALLAASMELNISSGMKPGAAATATAAAVNRFKERCQDRISGEQVARWRSELRQAFAKGCGEGARQNEDGIRQYRNTLDAYKQLYPADPAAAALEIAHSVHRFAVRIPPTPQ
jgi:hypothetical protein